MMVTPVLEYVGGKLAQPENELEQVLEDPNTGDSLGPLRASSHASLEAALTGAHALHRSGTWGGLPWPERTEALARFAEQLALRTQAMALADSLHSGVPITTTTQAVRAAADLPLLLGEVGQGLLEQHLQGPGGGVRQSWLPLGPAVAITPWNAPAPVAISKVSFALAAGAPVILKPSEWAPGSATLIAEAALAAGLPPACLQIVHGGGEVAQALVQDERVAAVTLTGGTQAGRAVARATSGRLVPLDLELAGVNPFLMLPGADLETTVTALAEGMLFLNGQWCCAPRRVLAPANLLADVLEGLLDELGAACIGNSHDPATTLGPVAHRRQHGKLLSQLEQLERQGAKLHTRGTAPRTGGFFVTPAVAVDGPAVVHEEIFGPVVQLHGYDDVASAVRLANDHPYGLAAYVFGPDHDSAAEIGTRLHAGLVRVNTTELGLPAAEATAGMWGASGIGSAGLSESLRFFTGARCVG